MALIGRRVRETFVAFALWNVGFAVANDENSPLGQSLNAKVYARSAAGAEQELVDPWVDTKLDVLPASACAEMIAASEAIGYDLDEDSIDDHEPENSKSQDIYVLHLKKIVHPELYNILEPYLPRFAEIVKERQRRVKLSSLQGEGRDVEDDEEESEPSIDWIFLRKYSPRSARNSLKVHNDNCVNSISVSLNDDYEGGGFFVVRRPKWQVEYDTVGDVPLYMDKYDWLHGADTIQNNTFVIFPHMPQGSATLINHTVNHGVAPLKEDSTVARYALLLFYDEDRYMEKYRRPSEEGGEREGDDDVDGEIVVEFVNAYDGDENVDLFWIDPGTKERVLIEAALPNGEDGADSSIFESTYEGHEFEAELSKSKRIVGRWVISNDGYEEGEDVRVIIGGDTSDDSSTEDSEDEDDDFEEEKF